MDARQLSDALALAVERAAPTLLRVEGRRRPSSGFAFAARLVVTAAHTLHRDEDLFVGLPDGRRLPARLLGRDDGTDVAVLAVDDDLPVPTLSESGASRVGELVLSLGRPGAGVRAALGMVAAVNGPWRTGNGARIDRWIDVDGSLPPGLSGGPLLDAEGAVVGMNTSALARGGGTVPVATLRRVVEAIVAHGGVRRGWLGVGVQTARLDGRAAVAGQDRGLLVISVLADGPAARAGLQVGDILLAFDGASLAEPGELHARLDEATVDRTVTVRVLRGDAALDLGLTVAGRVAQSAGRCGR